MKMKPKDRDPLSCIPSAWAVRARLEVVSTEVEKLRKLLKITEELEGADDCQLPSSVSEEVTANGK